MKSGTVAILGGAEIAVFLWLGDPKEDTSIINGPWKMEGLVTDCTLGLGSVRLHLWPIPTNKVEVFIFLTMILR